MRYFLALLLLNTAFCEQKSQEKAPIGTRAVDYVSVRNRPALFGIVLQHGTKTPTLVAVQRAWLKTSQPDAYKEYRKQEDERIRTQSQILTERLKKWIDERKEDKFLTEYLNEQLTKLNTTARAEKPQEPTTQFMIIELEAKHVRRVRISGGERRKPLWLAYRERLKNIEIRSGEDLMKELVGSGKPVPKQPVDLSDRIPSTGDNDSQWAGRQAIIEQVYRQDPLKMSGTPQQLFVETNDGKQADVMGMVAKLMTPRIEDIVSQLTQPATGHLKSRSEKWQQQAVDQGKAKKKRVVFVKLVRPDPSLKEAVVEAHLIAQMPDKSWRPVWKTSHSVKPDERPELEKQLREDEQIKQILDAMQALGQEQAVTKAIRFGAATKEANRLAEDAYVKWRDKFFDDLRGPTLVLPRQP